MNIAYKTRNFYPDELRVLKRLKTRNEKKTGSKIKFCHFLVAVLSGAGLTYVASIIPGGFWTFLLGTTAVFAFAFVLFLPFKQKNRHKLFLRELCTAIEKGTVDTCPVNAKRIAIAPEYEDESDLYIIEVSSNEVLYLWDTEYSLNKKFPCPDFEIYEEGFFELTGRQIYPLSEKIQPVKIDKKAKWNFMKQYGAPGHLETEKINFDELLEKYNNCLGHGE